MHAARYSICEKGYIEVTLRRSILSPCHLVTLSLRDLPQRQQRREDSRLAHTRWLDEAEGIDWH